MKPTRRGFLAKLAGIVTTLIVGPRILKAEPLYNEYTFPPITNRMEAKRWMHATTYGAGRPQTILMNEAQLKRYLDELKAVYPRRPFIEMLTQPEPRLWSEMRARKA